MTTSTLEITATRISRARRSSMTDEIVRMCVVAFGTLAVALGLAFNYYAKPFPWLGAVLLLLIAAATRVFGIPLPGKGFASFAVGPGIAALIALDWAAGVARRRARNHPRRRGRAAASAAQRAQQRRPLSHRGLDRRLRILRTVERPARYRRLLREQRMATRLHDRAVPAHRERHVLSAAQALARDRVGGRDDSPLAGKARSRCSRRFSRSARSASRTARRRRAR